MHFTKKIEPPLTQGPQKKFGGPHVARGPHFGHVWVNALNSQLKVSGSNSMLGKLAKLDILKKKRNEISQ